MTDAGRLSRSRRLGKRLSARAKSTLRWLASAIIDDEKFHLWLENEHKFDDWMKHETLIASAIHAHKRKTEAPREFEAEFHRFERSGRTFPMPE